MKKLVILLYLFYCNNQLLAQSTSNSPTGSPDFNFIEKELNKSNEQYQSMINAGYYYDNITQKWFSHEEYIRKSKELENNVNILEHNRHITNTEGWQSVHFYFTNDPISSVYTADIYVKKGRVKKLKLNRRMSSKLSECSNINTSRATGTIANKRLGSYYGQHIAIYIDY